MNKKQLLKKIDATILKPIFDIKDTIKKLSQYQFRGFCSLPEAFYKHEELDSICFNNNIKRIAVRGFPFGQLSINLLANDINLDEIDVVCNPFLNDINMFKTLSQVKSNKVHTKIIVEPVLMAIRQFPDKKDESLKWLQKLNELIIKEGWNTTYVKSNTGMFPSNKVTVEEIKMLREIFSPEIKIKVSGGIRTLEEMENFISVGGDIFGISLDKAIEIIDEKQKIENK